MMTVPPKIELEKLTSQEARELRRAEALRSNLIKRKHWQQAQANLIRQENTALNTENGLSQQPDQPEQR